MYISNCLVLFSVCFFQSDPIVLHSEIAAKQFRRLASEQEVKKLKASLEKTLCELNKSAKENESEIRSIEMLYNKLRDLNENDISCLIELNRIYGNLTAELIGKKNSLSDLPGDVIAAERKIELLFKDEEFVSIVYRYYSMVCFGFLNESVDLSPRLISSIEKMKTKLGSKNYLVFQGHLTLAHYLAKKNKNIDCLKLVQKVNLPPPKGGGLI